MKYLLAGYWFFNVNGRKFLTYAAANRAYDATPNDASLLAWHWKRGYEGIKLTTDFLPLSAHPIVKP
jgi:hypothetical protein